MRKLKSKIKSCIPSHFHGIFSGEKYHSHLQEYERCYGSAALSVDNIFAFHNNFINREILFGDKFTFVDYYKGKYSVSEIKRQDYKWALQEEVWENLSATAQLTILNWLKLEHATGELPPTLNNVSPYLCASYYPDLNKIDLGKVCFKNGLQVASTLIHEIEHYRQFSGQVFDDKSTAMAKDCGVELKKYLQYKNDEKKQIVTLNHREFPQHVSEIHRLKDIVAPYSSENFSNARVTDINSFANYLGKEIYIYSPTEREAFEKENKEAMSIVSQFRSEPSEKDEEALINIHNISQEINSLARAPIMKMLNQGEREDLFDAFMQTTFFATYYEGTEEAHERVEKLYRLITPMYNQVKDSEGRWSPTKSTMER